MRQNRQVKNKQRQRNKMNLELEVIAGITYGQRQFIESYLQGLNILCYGSSGSGKTFLALHCGLRSLLDGDINKIIFVRSAVEVRSQGFLPGDKDEKSAPYAAPLRSTVNKLFSCGTAYETLKAAGKIEFITTGHVRGETFDDSLIIVDEFQSLTPNEMLAVLTRVGENSRVIVIGDTRQNDLNPKREESCFGWMLDIASKMSDDFDMIEFTYRDIVRSGFVKRLIMAVEED
jgi:phosphate starvation-inducible PhoH-like protein